ncbi:MAG: hypothetical protein HY287_00900 [Planctomycetes bacterium]|nr:hypothetical protein [Planctomycetota bacterium]MBI3832866.1 hypothetical protein [Planctomycetota bacterium]
MRTIRFEPDLLFVAKDDGNADLISIESSDLPGGYVTTSPPVAENAGTDAVAYAMAAGTETHRGALAGAILGRLCPQTDQRDQIA